MIVLENDVVSSWRTIRCVWAQRKPVCFLILNGQVNQTRKDTLNWKASHIVGVTRHGRFSSASDQIFKVWHIIFSTKQQSLARTAEWTHANWSKSCGQGAASQCNSFLRGLEISGFGDIAWANGQLHALSLGRLKMDFTIQHQLFCDAFPDMKSQVLLTLHSFDVKINAAGQVERSENGWKNLWPIQYPCTPPLTL